MRILLMYSESCYAVQRINGLSGDVSTAKRQYPGIYITLVLLLRSLRAYSLGVVLVKVARCLCIYRDTAFLLPTLFIVE